MAIYHCRISNIGRSNGRSAVAAAAYRSGEKLEDEEQGITHDYTKKQGVVYSNIALCENAPEEYQNRATLWNAVQEKETAKDARLAREWECSIPNELDLEQAKKLCDKFAKSLAQEGMCVDYSIHWNEKDEEKGRTEDNHHCHFMGTTRSIDESGKWTAKSKKVYDLDENGEKIPVIDKKTGQQKVDKSNRKQWKNHKEDYNDWNRPEKVEEWRARWANCCNEALEEAQIEERVDHRSYTRQGVDRQPTVHEGTAARQIEARGGVSETMQLNRDIREYNRQQTDEAITVKEREAVFKAQFERSGSDEQRHESLGGDFTRQDQDTRAGEGRTGEVYQRPGADRDAGEDRQGEYTASLAEVRAGVQGAERRDHAEARRLTAEADKARLDGNNAHTERPEAEDRAGAEGQRSIQNRSGQVEEAVQRQSERSGSVERTVRAGAPESDRSTVDSGKVAEAFSKASGRIRAEAEGTRGVEEEERREREGLGRVREATGRAEEQIGATEEQFRKEGESDDLLQRAFRRVGSVAQQLTEQIRALEQRIKEKADRARQALRRRPQDEGEQKIMATMQRFEQISKETQKARDTSQTHENTPRSVSMSKFDKIYADNQKARTEPSSPLKTDINKNSNALSKFERISNAQRNAGREEPKKQEEERTEAVHRRRGIHR